MTGGGVPAKGVVAHSGRGLGVPAEGVAAPSGRGLGAWIPAGTGKMGGGVPEKGVVWIPVAMGKTGWGYGLDRLICWEYS